MPEFPDDATNAADSRHLPPSASAPHLNEHGLVLRIGSIETAALVYARSEDIGTRGRAADLMRVVRDSPTDTEGCLLALRYAKALGNEDLLGMTEIATVVTADDLLWHLTNLLVSVLTDRARARATTIHCEFEHLIAVALAAAS